MMNESDHAAFVDTWLESSTKSLSPELRLEFFEASLGALWNCTRMTLGDVTLMAIMDRVLYNATEKFPFFSALRVEANRGFQGQDLRERVASVDDSELMDGIRFVLVEFLTVIGNLTAEILTPELHTELSKVVRAMAGLHTEGEPGQAAPREHGQTEGEEPKA
jgi:hypothetical protein